MLALQDRREHLECASGLVMRHAFSRRAKVGFPERHY